MPTRATTPAAWPVLLMFMAPVASSASPAAALPALPGLARAVAAQGEAGLVRFRIQDQLDERELDESTTIYVNRTVVGAFHLDRQTPQIILDVAVPPAEHYEVALCGSITFRGHDGEPETHRVDSIGEVDDVEGRVFEALGAADFTEFYLVDRTRARQPTSPRRGEGGVCVPATS
jgi:hypothetical protein